MDIRKTNEEILYKVSGFLNFAERAITKEMVEEVAACGVSRQKAVELLLAGYLDMNEEQERAYLPYMLKRLDAEKYQKDEYFANIYFPNAVKGNWRIAKDYYAPYEIFVQDDFIYDMQKVLPQLGYFEERFEYPAIYQDGRLWMSVTPNEINTMREPIARARGKVLTFGLGLGYFAYRCSVKDDVESVTVIERDKDVIALFNEFLLPQFAYGDKIRIINDDAYAYLDKMQDNQYDYAFVDIYHDAGDGVEVYEKFKHRLGKFSRTQFDFWIEKTIKYYLDA